MNKDEFILKRVEEHYEFAEKQGYEIVMVALQGSQNYGLDVYSDEYKSDVDTKAIVLPKFEDFCKGREPVSKTLILPNDEHCDVKDIRVMFNTFQKQNINFIEILFSQYVVINPKYEDLVEELLSMNEEVARINYNQALRCMAGMSMEKLKAMEHPYPTIKDKIDKYGYDPKQLHHILRMNDFIKKFISGKSYAECLIPTNPEYLKSVKTKPMPLRMARSLAVETDKETSMIKNCSQHTTETINFETIDKLSDLSYRFLKRYMKEQILN